MNYDKIRVSPDIGNYTNHIKTVGCEELIDIPPKITVILALL